MKNRNRSTTLFDKARPYIPDGPRIMTCIGYMADDHGERHIEDKLPFGPKIRLDWHDEVTGVVLSQYFPLRQRYSRDTKLVSNLATAFGKRPEELNDLDARQFVGLSGTVQVETVWPKHRTGALKGQRKSPHLRYSKVSEILEPLRRISRGEVNRIKKAVSSTSGKAPQSANMRVE